MQSINRIRASDGSGNASVATVQDVRSAGAKTIQVDTTSGIPDQFYASMGTPHTFQDPVTGEDITVISQATATDFKGHVDGTELEIDEIAPGYVDGGSEVGDIIIIRPITEWANNVAEVLEESHNDDGTLKPDTVDTPQIKEKSVTPDKRSGGIAVRVINPTPEDFVIDDLDFEPKLILVQFREGASGTHTEGFSRQSTGFAYNLDPIVNHATAIGIAGTGNTSSRSTDDCGLMISVSTGNVLSAFRVVEFLPNGAKFFASQPHGTHHYILTFIA